MVFWQQSRSYGTLTQCGKVFVLAFSIAMMHMIVSPKCSTLEPPMKFSFWIPVATIVLCLTSPKSQNNSFAGIVALKDRLGKMFL